MRDGFLLMMVAITMLITGLVGGILLGGSTAKCNCTDEIAEARSSALQASSKRCGEMMAVLARVKEHDKKHGYPHQ
jgi:hypothetical protein